MYLIVIMLLLLPSVVFRLKAIGKLERERILDKKWTIQEITPEEFLPDISNLPGPKNSEPSNCGCKEIP